LTYYKLQNKFYIDIYFVFILHVIKNNLGL